MKREKSYIECLRELTAEAVYKGLLRSGFFAEKLPPIFTSAAFFEYCKASNVKRPQTPPKRQYIVYENIGHNNLPRLLGIPAPFAYERLCYFIKEFCPKLLAHFAAKSKNDGYKVSRIHVRKLRRTDAIFEMSYKTVGDRARNPIHKIKIGKRYKITSDISQCFPSIYTHSIAWALASKPKAKVNRSIDLWYNRLDHEAQANKYGETNGLLIGPHASNILSEIILVCVDAKLSGRYQFIRSIDDYECYAKTREEAEAFVVELSSALKDFNLSVNRKKTKIIELPTVADGDWTRKLRNYVAHADMERWSVGQISAYLDVVTELHLQENDAAVLFYALKQVSKIDLTEDARVFYVRQILQLTALRPYLFTKIDGYLFDPFNVPISEICEFSERMYVAGLRNHNYEAVAFALFYAIKYRFKLEEYDAQGICKTEDVIAIVLGNYYAKILGLDEKPYQDRIKKILALRENDLATFCQNWLHCYEFASKRQLANKEGFRDIKNADVSFLKPIEAIQIEWNEKWEKRFVDWRCNWEGALCEDLIEMARKDFIKSKPSTGRAKLFSGYFKCVLTNLYLGVIETQNVIIPKSLSSYKVDNILDYRGETLDFDLVSWVLRWLKLKCYIGERCGGEGEGATFYWVKNKLRDEFGRNALGVARYFPREDKGELVVVRNGRHQEVSVNTGDVGARYASVIAKTNAVNGEHCFTCRVIRGWRPIPFIPKMRAIFNMSSTRFGGRLYPSPDYRGPDYQNIHADSRPTIEIDNAPIVELDYSGLHINILYAKEGMQCQKDPYAPFGEVRRPAAKLAILIMINAKRKSSVARKLKERRNDLASKEGLSLKSLKLLNSLQSIKDIDSFVSEVEAHFAPLAKYFYHDMGRRLQREDSELAIRILDYFSKKSVPVLSVHDSFIVPIAYKDELRETMERAFEESYPGFKIQVK